MAWIYVLKNKVNGKMYVGQTIDIKTRFREHKNSNKGVVLHLAIKKYNWDSFEKYVFQVPEDLLDCFEIALIKNLNTLSPNGYNIDDGGNYQKHRHMETKSKISKTLMGRYRGKESPVFGRKCSLEERQKISLSRIGKYGDEKNPRARKVICIETGEVFNCIKYANIKYNINRGKITEVCKGRRKRAGKLHWMYYEDYLKQQKDNQGVA